MPKTSYPKILEVETREKIYVLEALLAEPSDGIMSWRCYDYGCENKPGDIKMIQIDLNEDREKSPYTSRDVTIEIEIALGDGRSNYMWTERAVDLDNRNNIGFEVERLLSEARMDGVY